MSPRSNGDGVRMAARLHEGTSKSLVNKRTMKCCTIEVIFCEVYKGYSFISQDQKQFPTICIFLFCRGIRIKRGKCYQNCKMTWLPVINRICIESSRIALRPDQERDETSAPLFEQIPRRNRGKATQLYFLTKPLQLRSRRELRMGKEVECTEFGISNKHQIHPSLSKSDRIFHHLFSTYWIVLKE